MKNWICIVFVGGCILAQVAAANSTQAKFTCDFGRGLAINENSSKSAKVATDQMGVFVFTFDLKTKTFTNAANQGGAIYIPDNAFDFAALQPMDKHKFTSLRGDREHGSYGIIRFTGGNADDSLYFLDLYFNVQDSGVRAVFTTMWDTAVQTFSAFDCKVEALK